MKLIKRDQNYGLIFLLFFASFCLAKLDAQTAIIGCHVADVTGPLCAEINLAQRWESQSFAIGFSFS
jgi:hypothetical protein